MKKAISIAIFFAAPVLLAFGVIFCGQAESIETLLIMVGFCYIVPLTELVLYVWKRPFSLWLLPLGFLVAPIVLFSFGSVDSQWGAWQIISLMALLYHAIPFIILSLIVAALAVKIKANYKTAAKPVLREQFKAIRREMSEKEKAASDSAIFGKLIFIDAVRNAETVLCYDSMPIEVDTKKFIAWCEEHGKKVLFPKVMEDNSLTFGGETQFDLRTVCITPALVVDKKNNRLGFGGGCYDRFLSDFKGTSIVLCYECCLAAKLPTEPTDVALDIKVCG
jgi:5-formyltetrahydrofolate cyclo-ligase